MKTLNHSFKFVLAWAICFAVRLIPFRPANMEPIMANVMPFSKRFGPLSSFLFGFASIAAYDTATAIGPWTMLTGIAYGLVGIGAHYFFRDREASRINFVGFAAVATILYDAATGLTMGPLFFHQPFLSAVVGQIPFTLSHLAGNVLLAIVLSPLIDRWLVRNPALELPLIANQKTGL